jgi:hypothetical protein
LQAEVISTNPSLAVPDVLLVFRLGLAAKLQTDAGTHKAEIMIMMMMMTDRENCGDIFCQSLFAHHGIKEITILVFFVHE